MTETECGETKLNFESTEPKILFESNSKMSILMRESQHDKLWICWRNNENFLWDVITPYNQILCAHYYIKQINRANAMEIKIQHPVKFDFFYFQKIQIF